MYEILSWVKYEFFNSLNYGKVEDLLEERSVYKTNSIF